MYQYEHFHEILINKRFFSFDNTNDNANHNQLLRKFLAAYHDDVLWVIREYTEDAYSAKNIAILKCAFDRSLDDLLYKPVIVDCCDEATSYVVRSTKEKDIEVKKELYENQRHNECVKFSANAAKFYIEAAKVAELDLKEHDRAYIRYLNAAECYRKMSSGQAYECYQRAINLSVKCGHIYEMEYGDLVKSNEFYDKAELYYRIDYGRCRHCIEHSCQFTSDYVRTFVNDISISLIENPKENHHKFKDVVIQTIEYIEKKCKEGTNAAMIQDSLPIAGMFKLI
ncbi:hypothetical protein RF11_02087 [Thelohanellus kitauei]|uniref:Alpha-soluble NSF attachment protein n=1 Tax=Thelohanellus kitauei TaxID=669202 RepID=A0A0C2MXT2_THEKT|nr:hypothetical protein RF11_02087 [Thelohanellus kitauei]